MKLLYFCNDCDFLQIISQAYLYTCKCMIAIHFVQIYVYMYTCMYCKFGNEILFSKHSRALRVLYGTFMEVFKLFIRHS